MQVRVIATSLHSPHMMETESIVELRTDGPYFFTLAFSQGDLDRQRLLGNRQRIALYEAGAIDDYSEGLEHQER